MKSISGHKPRHSGRVRSALLLSAIFLCSVLHAQGQRQAPEGEGKQIIEDRCDRCHDLNRVFTPAGHTPEEWRTSVNYMGALSAMTRDEIRIVTDYLIQNFPDKAPKPVVVPGSVETSIQEWTLPTPNSKPHDPLVAPDGSIWYTGIRTNLLGRFDPKTGQFREYPLKTPRSGPHGLDADKEGNIWFTASAGAYIGKLDPKTGEVTEYRLPDPNAHSPHTPLFDQKGTLWFTMSEDSMVGRIIPETGEVKLVRVPTHNAHPYGLVVNSKGIPFFSEYFSNKLASIDPETMKIREYVLPNPDTRPRRIAITSDDAIWYTDFPRGALGRFDPATGKASEWTSPGGVKSKPYGIAIVGDIVWYSESGVRPNTVVRFDPKTETFQTWVIPSGGGIVRNINITPDGDLWLALSGVNGIARVEVKSK